MLFPIKSESRVRRFPVVTVSLIAINILVFLVSFPSMNSQDVAIIEKEIELREIEYRTFSAEDPSAIIEYASEYAKDPIGLRKRIEEREIPMSDELWEEWKKVYDEFKELKDKSIVSKYGFVSTNFDLSTLITSIFLHGSIMHLFGNMWFLWLVGLNVEDDWGRPFFLGFYLLAGIIASLLFAVMTHSNVPLIGASGAIAGVMGAFSVQYYKSKISFLFIWLFPFVVRVFPLYAWFYLPLWFVTQLFYAIYLTDYSNVAFWAHVGGFGFGIFTVVLLRYSGLEKKYLTPLVNDTLNLMDLDFSKAVEARSTGDVSEAERHLKELLDREPSNLDAARELIDLYIKEGKKKEAGSIAKETFRIIRMEKREPEVILNFYEEILEENKLVSALSPYDFYFVSQMYSKQAQYGESAKVLAAAYKANRETNDAPYILLRLVKTLAESGNKKFLKKALREMQMRFPEMKTKTIAVLRQVQNGQK
jgi:membrane associated rhomboid family serine protease